MNIAEVINKKARLIPKQILEVRSLENSTLSQQQQKQNRIRSVMSVIIIKIMEKIRMIPPSSIWLYEEGFLYTFAIAVMFMK